MQPWVVQEGWKEPGHHAPRNACWHRSLLHVTIHQLLRAVQPFMLVL
jgi:hypothetical protein